jgi:methyl-accepting chemotaxis protein
MKNLKLGYKLALGFGFVLLFTTVVAVTAYIGLRLVTDAAENAATANDVARQMLEVRRQEKNFLLRGHTVLNDNNLTTVEQLEEHVNALEVELSELRTRLADPQAQVLVDDVDAHLTSYKITFDQFVQAEVIKMESEAALATAADKAISVTSTMRDDLRAKFQVDLRTNADIYTLRDRWQKFADVDLLAEGILEIQQAEQIFIKTKSRDSIAATDAKLAEMATLIESLKMRFTDAASDGQLDEILASLQTYQANFHAYIEAIDNQTAQESVLIADARLVEEVATELRANEDAKVVATQQLTSQLIVVSALLAVLAGIGAAWLITRMVTRPVRQLQVVSEQIAAGDLNIAIKADSKDELGAMTASFQQMIGYLKSMAHAAGQIADGNLAVEVTPQSPNDQLGVAFSGMVHNLQQTVTDLQRSAETVAAASEQLIQTADQSGQATQQIAITIDQVAQGTAQQTAGIQRTQQIIADQSHAISDMATGAQYQAEAVGKVQRLLSERLMTSINQVDETARQSEKSAMQAKTVAQTGVDAVRQTIEGMQVIAEATKQVYQRISEMNQRSNEVGTIVQTIDEIAERTNLLALNAAIEAARAGEHGRGFAVVADEVRRLAEQSARSAGEITNLISILQRTAGQAASSMDQSSRKVEQGVSLAAGAEQSLGQIQQVVGEMGVQIEWLTKAVTEMSYSRDELESTMKQVAAVVEENTASTEELAASSDQVLQAIEDVSAVSEQNSAAAEEVSAGAEEVSAQVEETVASAGSLSRMAVELRRIASRFRLSDTPTTPHSKLLSTASNTSKTSLSLVTVAPSALVEVAQPEPVFVHNGDKVHS